MQTVRVKYDAPPTLAQFLDSNAFVRWVVGPVGSGKSSACVLEILRRAREQEPGPDGIRRTRFAIIRNTYRQLQDTTRKTFEQWIPAQLGRWYEQEFMFVMEFGDVECEVLFRALDRPEDINKLLSLELTGAYINEARELPRHVFEMLQTRVGRYPSKIQGGPTWFGIWADTNPWHGGHWARKTFEADNPDFELYRQPGGRDQDAENVENLPPGYYDRLVSGKDQEWVSVYVDGRDAENVVGAIWGAWIAGLEKRGGVSAFEHPTDGVFTNWDLGRSDSTGIWFWRVNSHGVADVIDHYENRGKGLSHYFDLLESKPYTYEKHWLPHDARAKTLATDVSVLDQCRARFGQGMVAIAPELSLQDGIAAARWLLEQPVRIHSRCAVDHPELGYSGLQALREYQFEWDEENKCYSRAPLHNWASHSADAFRYMALVVKFSDLITRKPVVQQKPVAVPLNRSFSLDQLFELNKRQNGGRRRI